MGWFHSLTSFVSSNWKTIAVVAAGTLIFGAALVLTGGTAALLAPTLGQLLVAGVASGMGSQLVSDLLNGQKPGWDIVKAGAISGVITVATAGLGRFVPGLATPLENPWAQRAVVTTVGAGAGAGAQVISNAIDGKPLGDHVLASAGRGAVTTALASEGIRLVAPRIIPASQTETPPPNNAHIPEEEPPPTTATSDTTAVAPPSQTTLGPTGFETPLGTSPKVGDFTGLQGKTVTDILERVPSNASVRPLRPDPNGGAQQGVEYKWNDGTSTWRVRIHDADGTAGATNNAGQGWVFRVQKGSSYMDDAGNWYKDGAFNPRSSNYAGEAEANRIANATHMPLAGNPATSTSHTPSSPGFTQELGKVSTGN